MLDDPHRKNRALVLFSVLIASLLILLYGSHLEMGNSFRFLRQIQIATNYFFHSFELGWEYLTSHLEGRVNTVSEIQRLKRELMETQQKLLEYRNTYTELDLIKREKERLEEILGYKKQIPYTSIPARIISKDPQNLFSTIVINKGSHHNIELGYPVIGFEESSYALVGKIFRIYQHSAKIITILDQRCQVGVMLGDTGDTAIMRGQLPSSHFSLVEFLSRQREYFIGASVVTSSLGEKYPKGISIGKVVNIQKKTYGLFQSAEVKPTIDFFQIDNVFVLIDGDKKSQ